MNEEKNNKPELSLLRLIDDTQKYIVLNREQYSQSAMSIINNLYRLFFNKKELSIIGINHRIKSTESLKEKILRKKLYKGSASPEQVISKMSDIIGIMIECEFMSDEQKIFCCIKEAFDKSDDGTIFYNSSFPDIYINLGMQQPVKQKNGNELYKLDCYYIVNGDKINFELQIKALVNSFWCEVEHNIVYKNNGYISSDNYVNEMLSAVRTNLMGLDRILELVNNRISALTAYNVVKDLKLNSSLIKQMLSDLINAKMIDSVGFTVEAKRIRDLLAWYILDTLGPEEESSSSYFQLSEHFKKLQDKKIEFDRQIIFKKSVCFNDIFSQTIGSKLITLMNTDFEWHTFFIMLFQFDYKKGKEKTFGEFVGTIKRLFGGDELFEGLFERLSAEDAQTICDEAQMFIAESLCKLGDFGILPIEDYQKSFSEVSGLLQYTLSCLDNLDEWVKRRSAIQAVIEKSLNKAI
jgi:ppGpp synthetase/RelA/SpoT-type nucleotidyltranferase